MLEEAEVWTTESLPPGKQLSGFQEVFDCTHFHWNLHGEHADPYYASVRRREYEEFVFTRVVCDPVTGYRTTSDIKQGREEFFCLLFFECGRSKLEQGRNESIVCQDSIAVWDSTRPAMFQNDIRLEQVSILIPHSVAKTMLPGIEDMSGLTIPGDAGLGAILLSHLRKVHNVIESVDPNDRPAVLHATVELMAAAFRPQPELLRGSAFRRALLNRVQDYIAANLGDPTLSAASIAQVFRFSPRYLHRLFEEFDITVGAWIRKRRLLASRADLADRGQTGYSVTQIAMRHGFADASHFSRAFKEEFCISPRDYRRLSL